MSRPWLLLRRALSDLRAARTRLAFEALRRSTPQLSVADGVKVRCAEDVTVSEEGRLVLGAGVTVERYTTVSVSGTLTVGAGSYVSVRCTLGCEGEVRIGERVAVGPNVVVVDTNKVFDDPTRPITGQGRRVEPVVVEDVCWIGAGAVLLPGTRLGRGSVVGAGAVVRGSFPARSLVVGVPARVVRSLASPVEGVST